MNRTSALFLQMVTALIGIGALALLLWEPHLEGRNVNSTLFEIYFHDPFLAYVYFASIAFFVALYQAFKLLGYVRRNEPFWDPSAKALRTMKYCGMALIGFLLGAEVYLFVFMRGKDDIAGGVAIGLVLMFGSVVITAAAAVLERLVQNALEMKSENELTV